MRKPVKILGWVVLACSLLMGLVYGANQVLMAVEARRYPPPGAMVTVDGHRVHVFVAGQGRKTIVLLSGLGTPCPYLDFRPLLEALAPDYRVAVVEYLGYGWSDIVSSPRTNAAIVHELREALRGAGLAPPYILMPHSISGIYSMAYCAAYPGEVAGILGLDMTVAVQDKYIPKELLDHRLGLGFRIRSFLRRNGGWRLEYPFLKAAFVRDLEGRPGYTDYDRRVYAAMQFRNWGNRVIRDELRRIPDNDRELMDLRFPPALPVLLLIASGPQAESVSQAWGRSWLAMQDEVISNPAIQTTLVLEGEHYIHRGNEARIAGLARKKFGI